MFIDVAKKIIEKYFLRSDETITSTKQINESVVVTSNKSQWQLESQKQWQYFNKSENYDLVEVRLRIFSDPPPRPHGIAILPDGKTFHLNNEKEFCDFYQYGCHFLEPLELAGILTRYQGEGDNLIRNQNLIVSLADLAGRLEKEQVELIGEFTPFLLAENADQSFTLDFCTYFLEQLPPDYIFRFGLNRWQVEADIQGKIQWSIKLIARGLNSRRYSPNF